MRFSVELARKFEGVLDNDEMVIWTARPALLATLCHILPQLLIAPVFLSLVYWGVFRFAWEWTPTRLYFFFALTLMLLCITFILVAVFTTVYAVTNKRFRACFWFWGYCHRTISHREITEIDVISNRVDQWLGVGTIRIYLGFLSLKRQKVYNWIVGIREAEGVRDLMARLAKYDPLMSSSYAAGD